jgi:hypothetical protein
LRKEIDSVHVQSSVESIHTFMRSNESWGIKVSLLPVYVFFLSPHGTKQHFELFEQLGVGIYAIGIGIRDASQGKPLEGQNMLTRH